MSKKSNKQLTQRLLNLKSSSLTINQRFKLQKKVNYGTNLSKFTKSLNAMIAANKRQFYKTKSGIDFIQARLDETALKGDYLNNMKWVKRLYSAKKAIATAKGDIVAATYFKGKMEDVYSRIRTKQDLYITKSRKANYAANNSTPSGDVTDYINTHQASLLSQNKNDYVETFKQLLAEGTLLPLAQNASGIIYGYIDESKNVTSPVDEPYLSVAYKYDKSI